MPKKKTGMTPEEQSEKFRAAVRKLVDAGELNPTEADAALDRMVRKGRLEPKGGKPGSSPTR